MKTYGFDMGNFLSLVYSDINMEELQNSSIVKLTFRVLFFTRYFDDIITSFPSHQIQNKLYIFNTFNPNLQFTMKMVCNRNIAFLDV